MRFLKILGSDFQNESRDTRELQVVKSLGYEIFVLGRKTENSRDLSIPSVCKWKSISPLSPIINSKVVNRLWIQIPWALEARRIKADVISCHDIAYLFIGWLSTLFLRQKPLLIYDSHEFEYGRNVDRSKLLKYAIKLTEGFLMKRCAFSIMVNDSIADRVQNLHGLRKRPVVVRNIPNYWKIDTYVIEKNREAFLKKYSLPSNTFICMYHGMLMRGRGVENCIKALSKTSGTVLYVLGDDSGNFVDLYKGIAKEYGVDNRIYFHPAVRNDELWKYVGMANVGMALGRNICESYYLSLPNKFFENIQALTPMVCSNFPEFTRLIDKYRIGLYVDPENIDEIASAITRMQEDELLYSQYKNNIVKAKDELCWENEMKVLEKAYKNIKIKS